MAARLAELAVGYRFVDAIDGVGLTPDELNRLAPPSALLFDQPLIAAEIGCAATHLAVIREIAAGYSPVGIQLDYIRFPNTRHCFCQGCRSRFEQAAGVTIRGWPEQVLPEGRYHSRFMECRNLKSPVFS